MNKWVLYDNYCLFGVFCFIYRNNLDKVKTVSENIRDKLSDSNEYKQANDRMKKEIERLKQKNRVAERSLNMKIADATKTKRLAEADVANMSAEQLETFERE